ncbi:hypothetical protein [Kitasatospora sp. NPDC101183]|uniref:hypothetical protein n=1 Tax=Kitasatospora sp. NPDC101183 TaxID=3364100 RepID=UPI003811DB13
MQTVTTREILAIRRAYLTGPMATLAQRRDLARCAAQMHVPVADRECEWVWDADTLIVLPGSDECPEARCDVVLAECSAVHVHYVSVTVAQSA